MGRLKANKPSTKPIIIAIGFFALILLALISYRELYTMQRNLERFENNLTAQLKEELALEVTLKHAEFNQNYNARMDYYYHLFNVYEENLMDFKTRLDESITREELLDYLVHTTKDYPEALNVIIYDETDVYGLSDDTLTRTQLSSLLVPQDILNAMQHKEYDTSHYQVTTLSFEEGYQVLLYLDLEYIKAQALQLATDRVAAFYSGENDYIYIMGIDSYVYFHKNPALIGRSINTINDAVFIQAIQKIEAAINDGFYINHITYDFYHNAIDEGVEERGAFYYYDNELNLIFGKSYSTAYFSPLIEEARTEHNLSFLTVALPIYLILTALGLFVLKLMYDYAKKATQTIEEEEKLYQRMSDMTSQMILITDLQGTILFTNPIAKKVMKQDLVRQVKPFHERVYKEAEHYKFFAPNGKHYFVQIKEESIIYQQQDSLLYYLEDVTDVIEHKKSLEDQVKRDTLTKLYNRRALMEDFKTCSQQLIKLELAVIDFDDFKAINDTFGHDKGDEILKDIAVIFEDFSNEDIRFYRLGGDEFAVLSKSKHIYLKNHLKQVNKALWYLKEQGINPHFSFGITNVSFKDNHQFSYHYKEADRKLYENKNKEHVQ